MIFCCAIEGANINIVVGNNSKCEYCSFAYICYLGCVVGKGYSLCSSIVVVVLWAYGNVVFFVGDNDLAAIGEFGCLADDEPRVFFRSIAKNGIKIGV